jgi:hypothetical protein
VSEREEESGRFAVPGPESHESEETLSEDERGAVEAPAPAPQPPRAPYRRRGFLHRLFGFRA